MAQIVRGWRRKGGRSAVVSCEVVLFIGEEAKLVGSTTISSSCPVWISFLEGGGQKEARQI